MQEEEEKGEEGSVDRFIGDLDPEELALSREEVYGHVHGIISQHVDRIPKEAPVAHVHVLLRNASIVHRGVSEGLKEIITRRPKPEEVH